MSHWAQIRRYQGERLASWRRRAPPWTAGDAAVATAVRAAGDDVAALNAALLAYFWQGQQHYVDAHGTLADYPGWPSCYGARNDAVEGVTRLLPLWAAALGHAQTEAAQREGMLEALRRAFVHGTDPAHAGYWGAIGPRSTLICEAADVALAAWLARDTVWPELKPAQQRNLLAWLDAAVDPATVDNNWHLFAVLADAVCSALAPGRAMRSQARLRRIWDFALGDGCFRDGPSGHVDLYNAWGFHYLLFWLRRIAPELEGAERGREQLRDYLAWYRYLFTAAGLPLWGRSLCYRLATPLPLQLAAAEGLGDAAEANAAHLHCWRYFVAEGALRAGRATQGVFGEDMRWLDPYSGPASSFWGTRSLLLALLVPGDGRLAGLASAGPVQRLRIDALGAWLQAGEGRSSLLFDGEPAFQGLRAWPLRERLRGLLYGVTTRPANSLLALGWRQFDADLQPYRPS